MRAGRPADLPALLEVQKRLVQAGVFNCVPTASWYERMLGDFDWSARSRVIEEAGFNQDDVIAWGGRVLAGDMNPELAKVVSALPAGGISDPIRTESGYRMRLEPRDLANLRELPGSKGKSDRELGEQFFDGHAAKLAASLADDVTAPAEVLVFVDPYSRQAFLAVGRTIRGIVSF